MMKADLRGDQSLEPHMPLVVGPVALEKERLVVGVQLLTLF